MHVCVLPAVLARPAQVTAFECRTCNVLTEKRHASCAAHDVCALRVTKRWFTCEVRGAALQLHAFARAAAACALR